MLYHRIARESFDPWGLAVSPSNFAAQAEWLARNRNVLPLAEFAELHRRSRLPRDAVALTFDDGYACNEEVALPLLADHGLRATIFIAPELVRTGREFWWDELESIVLGHSGTSLCLDGREMPIGERDERDRQFPAGEEPRTERQKAYRSIWSILHASAAAARDAAMEELRQQSYTQHPPRRSHRPMTSDEIGGLSGGLLEFGSHSLTHSSLPGLASAEKEAEICDSAARCAELTGSKPAAFAYPYGDFDSESALLVEQAGYACACTTQGHFVGGGSDPFLLPRIAVGDWSAPALARLLG